MRRTFWAVAAAIACLASAQAAMASPVATDDGSYSALGRVFPDPLAGCQNAPPSDNTPCDPNAQGQVPATQFIGIDEFVNAVRYMNSKPQWQRYMDLIALDGKLGDGSGSTTKDVDKNNNVPLEYDPKPAYQSAGLPTTQLGRQKSDLMAVRVTDESVPDKGKKRYTLSLSIHGIERAGAEGGTRAMEDLVTAATTGRSNKSIVPDAVKKDAPTFADVLKHTIIYFTYPNPDGWRRGSVSSGGVFFQRYNGNGVDPNRDWPDVGYSFRPYSSLSEPETQAWTAFYGDVRRKTGDRFDAGDDLHGQPEADALSYTLLPHGRHRFDKNNRIQETAKRINRSTYQSIKWSPIVQPNDQPRGGAAPCVPGELGDVCSKIYAQTWGSVYDTINYTTTGALGDWFDSAVGLNADGIDNEMSFSHLDKNIVFEPQTEQLHVSGNKALIYAHLTELLQPSYDTSFDARGRKGFVPNKRVTRGASQAFPDAPPGTHPQADIDADVPGAGSATEDFTVQRTPQVYSGGMRVEVTNGNVQGIGGGSASLAIQCKGCDDHPGVEPDQDGYITVAEDFNQSALYAQAGLVATVNDPQPVARDGKPVQWRAVVNIPNGIVHFHIVFTQGPASSSGDTGGGPPPKQRAYNVANTDFFSQLNGFIPGSGQDMNPVDPKAVIAGRQSLDDYDTIALADDPLPGYTGVYGRNQPTGGPTPNKDISGTAPVPSQGQAPSDGSFSEVPFTIGKDDSDASATVTVNWNVPADDFDLRVFRKEDGGGRTLVASSLSPPPGTSEEATVIDPDPGEYIVQVENFGSAEPNWTGTVKFAKLDAGGSDTGSYTVAQKNAWFAKLRAWVRGGGNLVLTDGALKALPDLSPLKRGAVSQQTVYAGQSAFGTDDTHSTATDKLARGIVQQGARFNAGFRRQMYEPTPLGFAISDDGGNDASFARQFDVDRAEWEKVGGRSVAMSADAGARDALPVFTRVTIGELKQGDGQLRIAGALLPQPTEKFDHEFGLEPYAVTYTGYIIARNLLDAGATRSGGSGGGAVEPGKNTLGGRFVISRRLVKLRRGKIVRMHVKCGHRLGCRGDLRLKWAKRVRVKGTKRTRIKLISLGHHRFNYKHRRHAVIRVTLNKRGRKLIAAKRRMKIRASAPVRFGDGRKGVAKRRFYLERAAHSPHKKKG